MTYDIELKGCAPVPLAHYLKALGVLRLVAEQADPDARGFWRGDTFVLRSRLDRGSLTKFFSHDYRPTAIVVPWSGNDFFAVKRDISPGDLDGKFAKQPTAENIIEAIMATKTARLSGYCETIKNVFTAMELSGTHSKKHIEGGGAEHKKQKALFLRTIRNLVPDEVTFWLDACSVVEGKAPSFNNLLGSGGGSDGNSHFSDNFMQSLWIVLPEFDRQRSAPVRAIGGEIFDSHTALTQSLFGGIQSGTQIHKLSPVLFNPIAVGAANATAGFDAEPASNPWDFVFMIEGAVLFAGSLVKKTGENTPKLASFPFLLSATTVGTAAMANAEVGGKEIWLPLWKAPASQVELKQLFSEGRIEVHHRMAKRGLDAILAISQYGVDRGIHAFRRMGIFKGRTGGEKYLSTVDLGEYPVRRQPQVNLLSDLDRWLDIFTFKATSDKAPASAGRALRRLEEAILSLCKERGPARVQDVLIALGECERALVKSNKWANDLFVSPIPSLSPNWLNEADDGSPEFRLAASLASVYGQYHNKKGQKFWMSIRAQLEPIRTWMKDGVLGVGWSDKGEGIVDVVWSDGDPVRALNAVMSHRIMRAVQSGADTYPDRSRVNAEIGDIADFIEGRVDLQRMADLLWGLMLLDWSVVTENALTGRDRSDTVFPGAGYGLMKLCFPGREVRGVKIPLVPEIHRKASLGDGAGATLLAVRRLRGSGLSVPIEKVDLARGLAQRTAAVLIFPVDDYRLSQIAERVLRQKVENETKEE